jgi:hypothetical protein
MSLPVIQVQIGFQTTANFGTPFQLNDAVYGLLNTGTLGGIQFADVTEYVQSINITRGRSRQLQEFNAGTATIALYNRTRIFDPLNTSSPYYNTSGNTTGIVPRLPIEVFANGISIYSGIITDWNIDYDLANNDMAYVTCADNFTTLSSMTMNEHTTTAELSSTRVNTVLDYAEVNYQGARSIGTGSSTLGGTAASAGFTIAAETNVLNYLQTITTSEQGYLFMSADGTLTFKGRSAVLNPTVEAAFDVDSAGIPFQTLQTQFGDELLYNYIVTQSPAGVAQIAQDATSIAQYQSQTYSDTNLLNSTTTEVAALGNYLLGRFKQPVLRFTGLTTQLLPLSDTEQDQCLNLDLTDVCTVKKYFVTGTPTSDTQTLIVTGISHNITPGSHIVSYTFESTDGNAYFTLDDAIFGTLSTTNLLSF